MLPVIVPLLIAAVAADTEREVKSIIINHQRVFKAGSYAVVNYTLEFTAPILQRIYKLDGRVYDLDEHEWTELKQGKYTYFVVYGRLLNTHNLTMDVVTAEGTTPSITKIIVSKYYDDDVFFTGAKYGEKCGENCENCNETAMCVTDKSDCDQKTGLCSCRQGYNWNSTNCKQTLESSTVTPSISTRLESSTVTPSISTRLESSTSVTPSITTRLESSTVTPSISTRLESSTVKPSTEETATVPTLQQNFYVPVGQGRHIFIKTNFFNIYNFPVKQRK